MYPIPTSCCVLRWDRVVTRSMWVTKFWDLTS